VTRSELSRRALLTAVAASALGCGKASRDPPPPVRWVALEHGETVARCMLQPALVFFYAAYSVADNDLDREVFPSAEVREVLRDFVTIRVDMTDDERPDVQAALRRFAVVGSPTILVVDDFADYPRTFEASGRDLLRVQEYTPPGELAAALRRTKAWLDRT
jgi:hypothetical protein